MNDAQQDGLLLAVRAAEKLAFVNEEATASYHAALNRALGVNVHLQTNRERDAWKKEFSNRVRDGMLDKSDNPEELRSYIEIIGAL